MQNGPSKDELQNYWDNSRQYFDELASYYRTSDKDYYDKYIAPFYSPFHISPSSKGSGTKIIAVIMALIAFLGIGAAAFFLLIPTGSDNSSENNDNKQLVNQKMITDSVTVIRNDTSSNIVLQTSPYYDKGRKYYHSKDYENARKYFEMVPRNDKNYRKAQKELLEIKIILGEEDVKEESPR